VRALNKTALITGGSSGIGAAAAAALREAGCTVYTISRRACPEDKYHIAADVSDEEQARAAVKTVIEKEGRLDILVNCAGFGISGAAEFTENAEAQRQLDVNLFGTVNMTRAAIPVMRSLGAGRIVNISSVAAVVPIPFQIWYSISKAAINSWTMALANELKQFGISVCAVMPGDTKSGFTDARKRKNAGDEVYGGLIERSVRLMEEDERNGTPPEKIARFICRVATKKRVKPIYTPGLKYKLIVILARILPVSLSNWIIGLFYMR
jgi:NAD(P)-dependent dehydrogenase (short-subunit alcohol dehydrogenase family)